MLHILPLTSEPCPLIYKACEMTTTYGTRIIPKSPLASVPNSYCPAPPVPASLEPLITFTECFNRTYWADYELRCALGAQASGAGACDKAKTSTSETTLHASATPKPAAKSTTKPFHQWSAASAAPQINEHLTDKGKLTEVKHQHHMDAGACLFCKKKNRTLRQRL